MVLEASVENEETAIPPRLQDADHWELLMWAAIMCAKQWIRMQATSNPCHCSRFQETLQRVRRLVPFIKSSSRVESWGLLAERPQGATDAYGVSRGVLLLNTLFGVQLWRNLSALQRFEQAAACTTNIPTQILKTCTGSNKGGLTVIASASFAEDFERASLVLIWEWFLLEVAGAAPPAVLWTTFQEPIQAWARPQIRQAEKTLRAELADESYLCLLEYVCGHTQVGRLMDEMDAVDEARKAAALAEEIRRKDAAALREAVERRHQAAQARRQEEEEDIRRQQELEMQGQQRQDEQQRPENRRGRRARRAAQHTMDVGGRLSNAPGLAHAPQMPWRLEREGRRQAQASPVPAQMLPAQGEHTHLTRVSHMTVQMPEFSNIILMNRHTENG
jgi:hypothetical protein